MAKRDKRIVFTQDNRQKDNCAIVLIVLGFFILTAVVAVNQSQLETQKVEVINAEK